MDVITSKRKDILCDTIPSLKTSGLALLDGGLATHLEDSLSQDLSSSPLWSASLLQSEKGSKAIIQAHIDFLKAGADIISTSSYQVSNLAYRLAGGSSIEASDALIKSVTLADESVRLHLDSVSGNKTRPLMLLSLGPYGAALANGSEYTGDYRITSDDKENNSITVRDLEEFHFERLQIVAKDATIWQKVDLIAFETVPRLDEAVAIRKALLRLFLLYEKKFSYISFVFPNGECLPWPVPNTDDTTTMQQVIDVVLLPDNEVSESPLDGIGINCTKPRHLRELVGDMTTALAQRGSAQRPYLFLYPDGGLVWDGCNRQWNQDGTSETSSNKWCDTLLEAVEEANLAAGGLWAGCILGGCCKATISDIAALRGSIDRRTCHHLT